MTPRPDSPEGEQPADPNSADPDLTGVPAPDAEARAVAEPQAPPTEPAPARGGGSGAQLVAAGILLSRLAGLVREAVFARYFGLGSQADAFRGALRMPNVLQNLLGEGTLSASFIPVYSELQHAGRHEEAGKVAGAIFAVLLAVGGALSLGGVLLAPVLVRIFFPGFDAERYELTVRMARIIFPMTGILVLSAWALGILNSHRRFLLPYTAPVLWNAAMIAAVVFMAGRTDLDGLVMAAAWGALAGGVLQFAVQLPLVLRLEKELKIRWDLRLEGVKTTLRNAGPAVAGRGVVQLSGWLDMFLASWLAKGAISALSLTQTLYLLPISLFGMSIAAAELPELSRNRQAGESVLRDRMNAGLRQSALFVIPTALGYILIGRLVVGAAFQGGRFQGGETAFVHLLLATYAVGLFASTSTRLYSSAFYALHDTRSPARIAMLRVAVSGVIGAGLMLLMRDWYWRALPTGAVALAVGASVGAWLEWFLLRRRLAARVTGIGLPLPVFLRLVIASLAGCGVAALVGRFLPVEGQLLRGAAALAAYGAVYFPTAAALGVREASSVLNRVTRRLRR